MEKPEKEEADSQASSKALSCRLEGMQAWLRACGHSGGEVQVLWEALPCRI